MTRARGLMTVLVLGVGLVTPIAFGAGVARADSNITSASRSPQADSIAAAKKLAKSAKRQARAMKKRRDSGAIEFPNDVTARLDSIAAALLRGDAASPKSVPSPVNGGRPKRSKVSADTLPRTLASLAEQTSDEVISRDLGAMDAWEAKLATLPGAAEDVWRTVSAQSWIHAARIEYTDNDRQGFPQAAFERAVALISEIEAGKAPVDSANAPATVIPPGSSRFAYSLYTQLEILKRGPVFRSARGALARIEVELAWAGNEQIDQGECRTSPHLARAMELARAAQDGSLQP